MPDYERLFVRAARAADAFAVSNWTTTEADIDLTADEVLRAAQI